jgi:hypothetical protein
LKKRAKKSCFYSTDIIEYSDKGIGWNGHRSRGKPGNNPLAEKKAGSFLIRGKRAAACT